MLRTTLGRPRGRKCLFLSYKPSTNRVSEQELAHLSVYDERRDTQVVPFRLSNFDFRSDAYLRSTYLNVCGRYENDLELLQEENLQELFAMRQRNHWNGRDSLYEAWLLLKGETRYVFDLELFELKYPDWKNEKRGMQFNVEGQIVAPEDKIKVEERFIEKCPVKDLIVISDSD